MPQGSLLFSMGGEVALAVMAPKNNQIIGRSKMQISGGDQP